MMKLNFICEMTETFLKRKQCAIKKITKIRKQKKPAYTSVEFNISTVKKVQLFIFIKKLECKKKKMILDKFERSMGTN